MGHGPAAAAFVEVEEDFAQSIILLLSCSLPRASSFVRAAARPQPAGMVTKAFPKRSAISVIKRLCVALAPPSACGRRSSALGPAVGHGDHVQGMDHHSCPAP